MFLFKLGAMKQYEVSLIETNNYPISSVYKLYKMVKEHLIKAGKGICSDLQPEKDNNSRLIFKINTDLFFDALLKEINVNIPLGGQVEMIDGIKPIKPKINAEITLEQVEIMHSYKDTFEIFVMDNLGNLYGNKEGELIEIKK